MKKLIAIWILIIIFLVGCNSNAQILNSTPKNLDELLSVINSNHKLVIKPEVDYEKYITDYKSENISWNSDYPNYYDGSKALTYDEISEDVNYLFKCLKDGYGLYNYFGGDDIFDTYKDKLLEKYKNANSISINVFFNDLIENLAFIKDFHFKIYGETTNKEKLAYIFDEYEFQKINGKYINSSNGKAVLSFNESKELDDIFKLSISSDGTLVYYPIIISDEINYSINIKYSDESEENILYTTDRYSYKLNDEIKLDIKSEIPIIRVTRMGFDQSVNGDNARKFLEYATQYKDEKIVIVDLRNNFGGNGMLPQKWMMNFTSKFVPTNFSSLKYVTMEQIKKYIYPLSNNYQPIDELVNIYGFEQISDSFSKALCQKDEFISNDNLLIILVNKQTFSAGEMFVDIAHNLENTIIVGTNTAGGLTGDNVGSITLSNSKIPVSFGNGLSFFPKNYFEEFVGFKPDLWVKGDAEEAVLKLIENMKIK